MADPAPIAARVRVVDLPAEGAPVVREGLDAATPPPEGTLRWIDIEAQDAVTMEALGARFKLHPLAIEDCLHFDQRPKVEISRPFRIDQAPLNATKPDQDVGVIAFGLAKDDDIAPSPIDTMDGVTVLQLKGKELADRKAFLADKRELLQGFRSRKADDALTDYVARLREKTGPIKFDPKHVPSDEDKAAPSKSSDKG